MKEQIVVRDVTACISSGIGARLDHFARTKSKPRNGAREIFVTAAWPRERGYTSLRQTLLHLAAGKPRKVAMKSISKIVQILLRYQILIFG